MGGRRVGIHAHGSGANYFQPRGHQSSPAAPTLRKATSTNAAAKNTTAPGCGAVVDWGSASAHSIGLHCSVPAAIARSRAGSSSATSRLSTDTQPCFLKRDSSRLMLSMVSPR
jgi:hypothetical protein